jgi:predicted translin family RNA/ssDNA-binding protein
MTVRSFGSLLGATAQGAVSYRHTDQPVWRGSFDINDERAKVGRPFGDGSIGQSKAVIEAIVKTADRWADHFKEGGKAHALTQNVIKTLFRTLDKLMDYRTGKCEASYEMIMEATGFSRITVIRHMKILRDLKWIDWVRRTERTGNGPKDGPQVKQAANAYFFEISRLPLGAQIELRQKLKKRGIQIEEHPDRKGSGAVPNRVQRLAERAGQALSSVISRGQQKRERAEKMDEAAFIRGEMEFFGDIPTNRWAALHFPDDLAAQEAYNRRLGIDLLASASICSAPESPIPEPNKKNGSS